MAYLWVQLRAMVRKDWNQMKAEKCKTSMEVLLSMIFGFLIGYQAYSQQENPALLGFGYLMLLLLTPTIFQQSASYIANQMVKDRETRMKESLKIMGLQPWIYSMGFFVQRSLWMMLTTFMVCLFIWALNTNTYSIGKIIGLFVAL